MKHLYARFQWIALYLGRGLASALKHTRGSEDRARPEGWVAGRNTPQKLVWRARIVLMWAQGAGVRAIVRATGKTKQTAYRWHDHDFARDVGGSNATPRVPDASRLNAPHSAG